MSRSESGVLAATASGTRLFLYPQDELPFVQSGPVDASACFPTSVQLAARTHVHGRLPSIRWFSA
jgi:hypothetical protein